MVVAGRGTYVCETCQPRAAAGGERVSRPQLVQAPALRGRERLGVAAEQLAVDEHLGEAHHAGAPYELHAALGVLGEVDLGELQPAGLQQALDARAERAGIGRVDGDLDSLLHKV